ncbi:MAG: hypothetical protein IPM25_07015 [Chloracidobacterium sp.]|nr:hypothetical protein [Chloracidobacterium sp.]
MPLDIMTTRDWKTATSHWSQARSKGHDNLRAIDTALDNYHNVPKHNIEERIRKLNALILVAENYAKNKDTSGKLQFLANRRTQKVDAAEALAKMAEAKVDYFARVLGAERNLPAMFGVGAKTPMQAANTTKDKFLALAKQLKGLQQYIGPFGSGRQLHEDYWTEAIDPLHRNWHHPLNSPVFQKWVELRHEKKSTDLSFYRWFETLSDDELMILTKGNQLLATSYQSEAGREEFRVFVDGNKLKKLTSPDVLSDFNTSGYRTNFAGKGWCIFVMSPEGSLYCNNHDDVSGWFHAAFLGGKPVLAAGELFVKNGVLHAMTPKSGHYKPRQDDLINGLKELRKQGLSLAETQLMSFKLDAHGKGIMTKGAGVLTQWFDAEEYIVSAGARGLLREEGISKEYRFVFSPVTNKPQMVQGDEWLDKNKFKGWVFP